MCCGTAKSKIVFQPSKFTKRTAFTLRVKCFEDVLVVLPKCQVSHDQRR